MNYEKDPLFLSSSTLALAIMKHCQKQIVDGGMTEEDGSFTNTRDVEFYIDARKNVMLFSAKLAGGLSGGMETVEERKINAEFLLFAREALASACSSLRMICLSLRRYEDSESRDERLKELSTLSEYILQGEELAEELSSRIASLSTSFTPPHPFSPPEAPTF